MNEPRLTMDELGEPFGGEVAEALLAGRLLQAAIDETTRDLPASATGFDAATEASGGFGDRVMAALADEPTPAPTGFLLPLRRRGFVFGLWASFRQASVAMRGTGRPVLARAAALAYVLVLAVAGISLTGAAGAGALGLLSAPATESPAPTVPPTPAPSAEPSLPTVAPSPSPEATPSLTPTPSPSETPDESDDHGSGPEPSDDDSSGPGSGGGDDNSGPGSSGSGSDSSGPGSGDETPRPTDTPEPSETPH